MKRGINRYWVGLNNKSICFGVVFCMLPYDQENRLDNLLPGWFDYQQSKYKKKNIYIYIICKLQLFSVSLSMVKTKKTKKTKT